MKLIKKIIKLIKKKNIIKIRTTNREPLIPVIEEDKNEKIQKII